MSMCDKIKIRLEKKKQSFGSILFFDDIFCHVNMGLISNACFSSKIYFFLRQVHNSKLILISRKNPDH